MAFVLVDWCPYPNNWSRDLVVTRACGGKPASEVGVVDDPCEDWTECVFGLDHRSGQDPSRNAHPQVRDSRCGKVTSTAAARPGATQACMNANPSSESAHPSQHSKRSSVVAISMAFTKHNLVCPNSGWAGRCVGPNRMPCSSMRRADADQGPCFSRPIRLLYESRCRRDSTFPGCTVRRALLH